MSRSMHSITMNLINNYGCYCHFDFNIKKSGKPVDEFDQVCKKLMDNYECMELDNHTCDLEHTSYISVGGFGLVTGGSEDY